MVEPEKQKPHAIPDPAPGDKPEPEGAPDLEGTVVAEWRGQVFRIGERVVIDSQIAGAFRPEETGHSKKIIADYGQRGAVIGGEKRPIDPPDAPIEVLKVKWEQQRWIESDSGRAVFLDEFVATIHACYLAHVYKPQ